MFGPWIVAFGWLRQRMPTKLSALKPRLNFITLHYIYMIGMTLIGSILIYPAGSMAYIDALFFASGAATQSGLNTIDVNKIHLYQQIVIMLIACVCNPIFINTTVVFVRLYWFEKRFQHVVLEARALRRNKTRSRTRSEAKADTGPDPAEEEKGVGDRPITVVRNANGEAKGHKIEDEELFLEGGEGSSGDISSETARENPNGTVEETREDEEPNSAVDRKIAFADGVNPPLERVPEKLNKEQTIAFVENQRNPKDRGTLRIPGPRDFDRGYVPERIEEGDDNLVKETTNEGEESNRMRRQRSNSVPPHELNSDDHPIKSHITIDVPDQRQRPTTGPAAPSAYAFHHRGRRGSTDTAEGETPTSAMQLRNRARSRTFGSFLSKEREEDAPMPYLSWTPTVGRNSAFVDLTEDQREELGGIEYRSLKLLAWILVFYFVGFHLLGMICLLPWIVRSTGRAENLESLAIDPAWWGIFTPASMFNDLGFTLTPDSMISFQFAVLPLVLGTFLIIIGNTGFPCMLRFIIWVCSKCVPHGSGPWEELRFLLDHPRRCFTLLFPSSANWWLFWVLILLNGIDLIFFVILDLKDPTVTSLPPGFRFLDGLFQAASTRTAGFAVVNLADLHPAIQVSYLIMMYISIFPIAISLRQTNVYEEKSLGVWSNSEEPDEAGRTNSYLGTHLRRQLSFDLWYVFLGFFLIAIVEGNRLENTNDYAFTLFSVLFEIVSAYGTVGLSMGYPNVNVSFSGEFRTLSKLIIIAMQLRGRHRGLPYALDRAILLPSESLHRKEDEDATRRARRNSTASDVFVPGSMDHGISGTTAGAGSSTGAGAGAGGDLQRQGTGLSQRSNASLEQTQSRRTKRLGRFISGALSAGPTIAREKKA